MKLTPVMRETRTNLDYQFRYTLDGKIDHWHVITHDGLVEGDCEDYALTLLWRLSGGSWWRFWWSLVTFRAVIWHATAYNGLPHAVLWYKGWWADNMEHKWYRTADMRHKRRFPWPLPIVILKLLIGKLY